MTINHDPDKKMEKVESTKDEEIIELKEEAIDTSQDDEEIIDLLEEVDEPDADVVTDGILAQEPESEQDSDLIELEEEIFDVSQDDEKIIDLLEKTDEPDVTHEKERIVNERYPPRNRRNRRTSPYHRGHLSGGSAY